MSYARIAEARGVKVATVRNAVYSVQQKLGAGSMQGLVLWTVRNGLLDDYTDDYRAENYTEEGELHGEGEPPL